MTVSRRLTIVNVKGLHARASAKLVEVVEAHDARAQISRDGMSTGGDSIMGLLMLAASNGHYEVIKLLIDNGANIKLKDSYGTTALIVASTSGNTEIAATLIDLGADPLLKDTSGGSALSNATFFGHTETVKTLLKGVKILPDADGQELLMLSAGLGHIEIANALFDKGVTANARGTDRHTAILAATAFNRVEMVKLLLKHGADPTLKDDDGINAVQLASEKEFQEIIKLLKPN